MDKNKLIFGGTLIFSIILEWFVRKGAVLLYGIDGFSLWPWIDNVMHFMWGLNIFLIFFLFLKWEPLDALLGVFVWQMAWESMEIIGDTIISQPYHMFDHFFFDGIKDTALDIIGAGGGWFIFAQNVKKRKPSRLRSFMTKYLYSSLALMILGTIYFIYTLYSGKIFSSPNIFVVYWLVASAFVIWAFEYFIQNNSRKQK